MVDAGLTDLGLASACAAAAWRARPALTSAGLALVGLAAAVGTVRFLGLEGSAPLHDLLSLAAQAVGLPLVGLGAALRWGGWGPRGAAAGVAIGVLALGAGLAGSALAPAAAAACGMGAAAASGIRAGRAEAPIGAALVVLGGLGVAGEGTWVGVSRIAWFHLVMTVAVLALGEGSRRELTAEGTPSPR